MRTIFAAIILFFAHSGQWLCAQESHPRSFLENALQWIQNAGPAGPAIFVIVYILACVFFLGGIVLTLGAGAVFGVVKGSILVSAGSTLGASAAFLVGRHFARRWVEKKIQGNEKFKAIDDAVAGEGWKIVALTRLSPAFPFSLLNYGYGITKVSFRDYFFASWLGMMPGTVMYVYIGSIAGDAARLASGTAASHAQWTLRIIGLAATVLVTIYVTKIAKKALNKRTTI